MMQWDKVKQIWKDLHKNPELRKQLRPEIYDSWERCYVYNVSPGMKEISSICSEAEFKRAQEKSKYLMEMAIPVMERLSEFVKGTGFVVGLSDADCLALKIIGDQESQEWARHGQQLGGESPLHAW